MQPHPAGRKRALAAATIHPLAAVLVCGALAASPPARAQEARLRVVIGIASDTDALLAARVHGQVADLEVDVVDVPVAASGASSIADRIALARSLAQGVGAAVAVWFEAGAADPHADAVLACVADLRTVRVLIRAVGSEVPPADSELPAPLALAAGGGTGPTSATLEQAALVVRTALRALAAGGVIGVEPSPDAPPAPLVAASNASPAAVPPVPVAPVEPLAEVARGVELGWTVELGWSAAFDGGPTVAQGLAGRVGFVVDWFEVSVEGVGGFPASAKDAWATIDLSRHLLAVSLAARLELAEGLDLSLGLAAGAGAYRRSAGRAASGVTLDGPRTLWSFLLAPGAGLSWIPDPSVGFGFLFSVSGEWLPAAPVVGYVVGGRFEAVHELWSFQPRIGVSLVFESP